MVSEAFDRDPLNHGEAMRSGKRKGWEKAMEKEISTLEENDVWTVFNCAPGKNDLYTNWVYKTKTDARGNFERPKARLVACGNMWVLGVDYTLTLAAVLDLSTVKVIPSLVATRGVPARCGPQRLYEGAQGASPADSPASAARDACVGGVAAHPRRCERKRACAGAA